MLGKIVACLLLAGMLFAQEHLSHWKIITGKSSQRLNGFQYERFVDGFIHRFSIYESKDEDVPIKLTYTMREEMVVNKGYFTQGSISFSQHSDASKIYLYRTKPMKDYKRYQSCTQSVDAISFSVPTQQKFRKLFDAIKNRKIDHLNPHSIAMLVNEQAFSVLKEAVLKEVDLFIPLAMNLYDSFVFSDCEKGANLSAQLLASKRIKAFEIDALEAHDHNQERDLVNPMYLTDYIIQNSDNLRKTGHSYDLDLMGAGGLIDSIKNKVHYQGEVEIGVANSKEAKKIKTDLFEIEMAIPLVSWFKDLSFTMYVSKDRQTPDIVYSFYPDQSDEERATWILE